MEPVRLTLKAPAKINLFLRVTGRRPDGYHYLQTLMQKVSLYDEVVLESCAEGIHFTCSDGSVPANAGNLVWQAADLFLHATRDRRAGKGVGVVIGLTKRIPVAAGLGGGSSDAAATLRGLNALFGATCSSEELAAIGLRLGADVPFFLSETSAAFATGIGEILQPVASLRGYHILLVNPGFPVSTRWVYQTFALTEKLKASNLTISRQEDSVASAPRLSAPAMDVPAILANDLEAVTVARYPEIDQLKEELLWAGATGALMSGSGPTVFGLFADARSAEDCQSRIWKRFPHTYLVAPAGERASQ